MRPCFVLRQQSDPAGTRMIILSPLIDTFLSGLLYLIRTPQRMENEQRVGISVERRIRCCQMEDGDATYHPLSGFCHSTMVLSLRHHQSGYCQCSHPAIMSFVLPCRLSVTILTVITKTCSLQSSRTGTGTDKHFTRRVVLLYSLYDRARL